MPNFGDWFVDAVEINEGLDFTKVLVCLLVYFFLFWFAVSVWVYNDAKRRYVNADPRTPLLIALGVFILFFPALVFYLAVRPHSDDLVWDGYGDGGVNVPLVNFQGEKGIEMTLELNIHPSLNSNSDIPKDMKVDVEWKSQKDDMQEIEKKEDDEKFDAGLWRRFDILKERVHKILEKVKSKRGRKKKGVKSESLSDKDAKENKTKDFSSESETDDSKNKDSEDKEENEEKSENDHEE